MRAGLLAIGLMLLVLGIVFYFVPVQSAGTSGVLVEYPVGTVAMILGAVLLILGLVLPDPVHECEEKQ